ncbi:MAG: hypothetical protein DVB26_03570 [Verrucomicrobia bacterium]|nr:MAG: hypothetical protein DVB26_03570 [Verrucomicrobiota bacterium]
METQLVIPHSVAPSTINQLLDALRKVHFEPKHESKMWGDWIHLYGFRTVISIECVNGVSHAATIEHGDDEDEGEPLTSILQAFGKLGWHGIDENGEYPLVYKTSKVASRRA